ncbi:uncharacterized protein LOC108312910 [Cebus imitator]|uniref:uncharacterized protein LOC108312910 n=1 Tax=Cebus imitator TaxID=2715852 RepID=UPI00080A4D78|nr:uncharacterized protein LOC108312910 [Cebus imitator]
MQNQRVIIGALERPSQKQVSLLLGKGRQASGIQANQWQIQLSWWGPDPAEPSGASPWDSKGMQGTPQPTSVVSPQGAVPWSRGGGFGAEDRGGLRPGGWLAAGGGLGFGPLQLGGRLRGGPSPAFPGRRPLLPLFSSSSPSSLSPTLLPGPGSCGSGSSRRRRDRAAFVSGRRARGAQSSQATRGRRRQRERAVMEKRERSRPSATVTTITNHHHHH